MVETYVTWLEQWHHFLTINNERRLVVVKYGAKVQSEAAHAISTYCQRNDKRLLLWGDTIADIHSINRNFRHQLGQEYDVLLFNDEHFHADAFAALSGTIRAGGFLIWLQTEDQQHACDYFIARLNRQIAATDDVLFFGQKMPSDPVALSNPSCCQLAKTFEYNACSEDQLMAVKAILKVAEGRANRPLVLTADRGRGKSTALGLAAGHLLQHTEKSYKIAICAPVQASISIFFAHANTQCPDGKLVNRKLVFEDKSIEFYPVDKLLQEQPNINLLIVDEAAAIPLYLLNRLLKRFPRIVFSTTQHGYEGAGRGFATKFKQTLKLFAPNYRKLHLDQPIRWRVADPLESFVSSAFILNAIERKLTKQTVELQFEFLHKSQLFEDESLLVQVFGILVNSHYQTSPTDLKLILSNQKANIYVLRQHGSVVAVSLIIEEGQVNDEDVNLVKENKRQLKNQFIPQYLYRHCLFEQAFNYRYWRVSRIAVCQSMQGQGIGSLLMNNLLLEARDKQVDFIATSFAANAQVVRFWQKAGFVLTDLALNKDNASGEYSAVLLKQVLPEKQDLVNQIHNQTVRGFWYKLATTHCDIEPDLALAFVSGFKSTVLPSLEQIDYKAIFKLVKGEAQIAQSAFSIQQWLIHQINESRLSFDWTVNTEFGQFDGAQCASLLIQKFWLCHSDVDLVQYFELTGKKQLNRLIIESLNMLMSLTID